MDERERQIERRGDIRCPARGCEYTLVIGISKNNEKRILFHAAAPCDTAPSHLVGHDELHHKIESRVRVGLTIGDSHSESDSSVVFQPVRLIRLVEAELGIGV